MSFWGGRQESNTKAIRKHYLLADGFFLPPLRITLSAYCPGSAITFPEPRRLHPQVVCDCSETGRIGLHTGSSSSIRAIQPSSTGLAASLTAAHLTRVAF